MAKKAAKKAAPVKAEKTRSRAPANDLFAPRTMHFDKLGTQLTWKMPTNAYQGEPGLRSCYIGGFEARVHHVQQASEDPMVAPLRFPEKSKEQRAFEDGYHAAATQDGLHRAPRSLTGSNPEEKPIAPAPAPAKAAKTRKR